ncbi:MAG: acetoacetate--CoA ligase [Betaproteobacteria bacterium]
MDDSVITATPKPIWSPDSERIAQARINDYRETIARSFGLRLPDTPALWRWSVSNLDAFWDSIWRYFDVAGVRGDGPALAKAEMPGAVWFPGATLNFASQALRHAPSQSAAIIAGNESGDLITLSWTELARRVACLAAALRARGVVRGDRVAALLPNTADSVVAFLACASVGAIWSQCSPDMGAPSVLDRFRQITPKVLIAVARYTYGGRVHDRSAVVTQLLGSLHSLALYIPVPSPCAEASHEPRHTVPTALDTLGWAEAIDGNATLQIDPVPFEHPLWIVYSSGTTGLPKPIVNGHGGVTLEMLKVMALHNDLHEGDRFHWFTTTGWIMWNCQVSALLLGSTIGLYDGSPGWPDAGALWRFADRIGLNFLGAGAAFHTGCMKAGISPGSRTLRTTLRTVGSTGSPLSPDAYRWLQRELGQGVWIAPISGGTDLSSAFIAGDCTQPVIAGEMQTRCLGAAVAAWNDRGESVIGEVGELVCTTPMPSMPLFFWGDDAHQTRYRDSYFDMFPGVWRHGDWIEITPRGGAIVYGRSDATINRHGVRMGTSELYAAVEGLPEVLDSLVVDLEYLGRASYMPLFVVLRDSFTLDSTLRERIADAIRQALTPRHVPNDIIQVAAVPRTLTGKKLEVPVKRLLLGEPPERVFNRDAIANPDCLDWYLQFAERMAKPPH